MCACVCEHCYVDVTTTQRKRMRVWLSECLWYQSLSLSCEYECVCVGECVKRQVGQQPGGPLAADEDGWMNVNISFTLLSQRLGWFICLRCRCHFACLMCTATTPTDGSFWAPLLSWLCLWLSHGHLRKCYSRCVYRDMRASAVNKCAFVNMSGRPASSTIVFFIETSGVFQKQVQKNKCRNVVSRCSCPLQMVPLCGRVPSSPCHLLFSPTNCLLSSFYLSPSFKRALIHT